MNAYQRLLDMLEVVAHALGADLRKRVAFVGGSTTGLLVTDKFTREEIRFTEDIDLIIKVAAYAEWAKLQQTLRQKGFSESMEDDVICRMRLGPLKVDFMPDNKEILGFSNRWYTQALDNSDAFQLPSGLKIKILSPPYFVATKLEAWRGRGNDDPLSSHDLEDILNLIDGRKELLKEIENSEPDVKAFICGEIASLLVHRDFDYLIQGTARGNKQRESLLFRRLENIAGLHISS